MKSRILAICFGASVLTGCGSFSAEAYVVTPHGNYGAGISVQMGGGGGSTAAPGSSAAPTNGSSNAAPAPTPVTPKSSTSTTTTGTVRVNSVSFTAEVPNYAVPSTSGNYSGGYSNLRVGNY